MANFYEGWPRVVSEFSTPSARVDNFYWREDEGFGAGERTLAEEMPVALTYNGGTQAVMMATPQDLEDFAVGFSVTEGIISGPQDIRMLDVCAVTGGIDVRIWLDADLAARLSDRRRHTAGPTGCGLCGIESISEAMRAPHIVQSDAVFCADEIMAAMSALSPQQELHRITRATHAAGFWSKGACISEVREDVGRHNALDKVVGALIRRGLDASRGIICLTSRLSVEMVQKAAAIGAPVIACVSAPTGLAVRMAEAAHITVVAIARDDGFEVFAGPQRIEHSESAMARC
jgi:FdhD protein